MRWAENSYRFDHCGSASLGGEVEVGEEGQAGGQGAGFGVGAGEEVEVRLWSRSSQRLPRSVAWVERL